MTIAIGVISICAFGLGFLKVLHAISAGFSKIQHGQHELKEDFNELKTEMREAKSDLNEMKIDIAWVQASTKTPPRQKS